MVTADVSLDDADSPLGAADRACTTGGAGPRGPGRAGLATTLALVAMALGCRASEPRSVILVLVDTLRADRLGVHAGEREGLTPNLDGFARSAVVFEEASAQAPWTLPSVSSLFTGLYSAVHRVGSSWNERSGAEPRLDVLPASAETLAERFLASGYRTAALLKSYLTARPNGLRQGFSEFRLVPGARASDASAQRLTDAAIAWLERRGGGPFFLYLHYMDPHAPYRAPAPYGLAYADPAYQGGLSGSAKDVLGLYLGDLPDEARHARQLLGLYDGEVRYLDEQLGRLFAYLDAEAEWGDTVVAITADHGEQFHEHGSWSHHDLFVENLHVPLIVRAPGFEPRRVEGRVEMFDLNPTLCELAGIEPNPGMQARSLVPEMHGGRSSDTRAFAENRDAVALADGRHKLIWSPKGSRETQAGRGAVLYDVEADPLEENDLAASHPAVVERLRAAHAELARELESPARSLEKPTPRELTPEETEGMRELGYLE